MPKPERKTNRAPQGAGGICKRSNGRWQGTNTVGTNPGTGNPVKKYVYAQTEKECVKKLKALQAAIDGDTFIELSRMTVTQWLCIWVSEYLGSVKPNTKYDYERVLENYVKPTLGAVKLQKLNPHQVQQCYNALQREKALSAKTVKNVHGVFHSALKQAQRLGYVQRNPADNKNLPRVERPDIQPIPENILPAFLEAIQGHEFEAVFFVTVFTGMRKGEVLGLTWSNVDFERGTVCIRQQLLKKRGENAFMLTSPKNDKPRTISPSPSTQSTLILDIRCKI